MKHFFFDLDGCVTESRQIISPEMKAKLATLPRVIVISGAERSRMEYQLDGLDCEIMAQSGNETSLWKNLLTEKETKEIEEHIKIISKFSEQFGKSKQIDYRGCQISYAFVGHDAPNEIKKKFDPDKAKRTEIMRLCPFASETLEGRIAGTNCIDYTPKVGTKGKNIERFIRQKGWSKNECVYYGDNLQKGGNDESVLGVIKCIAVTDPGDLLARL